MGNVFNPDTGTFDINYAVEYIDNDVNLNLTASEEAELWAEYEAQLFLEEGEKEEIVEVKKDTGWTPDVARDDIMDITRGMF